MSKSNVGTVYVVGPFPPPIHGMAKNTEIAACDLEVQTRVKRVDISPGRLIRGLAYHSRRVARVLSGYGVLLFGAGRGAMYMPPDAGYGMFYSIGFVAVARIRRFPIFLHHRSFRYISRRSRPMAWLVGLAGSNCTHIFLCGCMKSQFSSLYGGAFRARVVSNAKYVTPIEESDIRSVGPTFVIGHMSNLGFEKGLDKVIEVVRLLRRKGLAVQLVLAGPPSNEDASNFVIRAVSELGGGIVYLGAVSGETKDQFFRMIDLFLFPTIYENEAQPNVVFEAMGYGVPVVSTGQGCIPNDLGKGGVIASAEDFVVAACRDVEGAIAESDAFVRRRIMVLQEISKQSKAAQSGYSEMIDCVAQSVA